MTWDGLSGLACVLGGVFAVLGAVGGAAPVAARAGLRAFPRHRPLSWVLTAVALAWCGRLLYTGPLGFLEPYRAALFVLVPVAIVLVGLFVDDLLAVRALGGLLILIPTPLLDAARWHPSAARYLVILLAYVMAVAGAILVTVPYAFRKTCERFIPTDGACRAAGVACVILGGVLIGLGLTAFR